MAETQDFTNTYGSYDIKTYDMENIKICEYCGKEFESSNKLKKYCDGDCRQNAKNALRRKNKFERIIYSKICPNCNTKFETPRSNKIYCSHACVKSNYYKENTDKIKERLREYRLENIDSLKEYGKNYRLKNPEKLRELGKKYREENKKQIKSWKKNHYKENKEEILKKQKEFRENNKDIILRRNRISNRKYMNKIKKINLEKRKKICGYCNSNYLASNINQNFCSKNCGEKFRKESNPEKYKELAKQIRIKNAKSIKLKRSLRKPLRNKYETHKRNNDPEYKLLINLRNRIYQALKNNSKQSSTVKLLGCSIEECKKHLEVQFSEGMSWDNHDLYGWHIDHIIPCSNFDLSKKSEQQKCFHYSNLQPLWAKENLEKGSSMEENN